MKYLIILSFVLLSACSTKTTQSKLICDNYESEWVYHIYFDEGIFVIRETAYSIFMEYKPPNNVACSLQKRTLD
jgi:hypothetical protein